MKIGIYSPYWNTLGGGERYLLTVAETLSLNDDNKIDLLLDSHLASLNDTQFKFNFKQSFDLDLTKVNFIKAPIGKGTNILQRLLFLRNYDVLFYVTDGSIFYSTAKHNFIHFQMPFTNTSAKNLWGRFKLSSWDLGVCNSKFTQNIIDQGWPIKTTVIYPPVDVNKIKPLEKKNFILSVGRFTSFTKSKKHEDMIKAFIKMYQSEKIKGWSLHLAGSVEGNKNYIDELKKISKNFPVIFYPNLSFKDLMQLYGESSIYWHAMGFGETDPQKMEHFGIATVEAMAAGCVPVVINAGGQKEIVIDGKNGFLWDGVDNLIEKTVSLIQDEKLRKELAQNAILQSQEFSKEKFQQTIQKLIEQYA